MLASELLKNGCGCITELLVGVENWMGIHEYNSIKQMQGSMSQLAVKEPSAFERANYTKILETYYELP